MGIIMAKTTKTMRITLTEDFLVPTDDGNIIFEPGDEIEVEYEDEDLAVDEAPVIDEIPPVEDPMVDPIENTTPAEEENIDPIVPVAEPEDPLSFAGNPQISDPEPLVDPADEEEVYIEDPTYIPTV